MANVTVQMTGDEARLFKSLAKVIAQGDKMEAGFKDIGKAAKRAGKDAEQAFGAKAMGSLKGYLAGMATGAAGVNLMTEALRSMREESNQAGRDLKKLGESNRQFLQVAKSAEDFAATEAKRDLLSEKFGIAPEEVMNLIFAGRGAGFEHLVPDILGAAQFIPPEEAAVVTTKMPALFQGQITGLESLNAVLSAAGLSEADFAPMATAIPKAAEGAAPAGSGPAEVAALVSVLSSSFASVDTAADRIKAFGSKVAFDEDLKGKGIVAAFRELQAMPEKDQREFVGGSQEVNAVFELLKKKIGEVEERREVIQQEIRETGTPQSELSERLAIANSSKSMQAILKSAQAEIALENARRNRLAEAALSGDAAAKFLQAEMLREGKPELAITGAAAATNAAQFVTRDPRAIEAAGTAAGGFLERAYGSPQALVTNMPAVLLTRLGLGIWDGIKAAMDDEPRPTLPPAAQPVAPPEVQQQVRQVQPAPIEARQPDVRPAMPTLPPEAMEQARRAPMVEAKDAPQFPHAMPKLPPLKDAPQGGILDVEDDLAGEFPHAAFRDRETTHANLAIDRLSQVADRLATAAERQERAALALAAATQGRPGRAVTPHKPSSRAAQLQERNAQRE